MWYVRCHSGPTGRRFPIRRVPDSMTVEDKDELDEKLATMLKRDENGLVAVIAQQYDTGEVLMLAWMDDRALAATLETGRATYYSRSRGTYWVKGATSGNVQAVHSVDIDCDGDAVLLRVDQTGVACHTGTRSCFSRRLPMGGLQ